MANGRGNGTGPLGTLAAMSEPAADAILAYERKFVPALAWSVRGAMLQFGGRMAIVEDDGAVVYDIRAGSWLIFIAILLGTLAIVVLVGPIVAAMIHPNWLPRKIEGGSTCVGAALLFPAIGCYLAAMSSFKIALRQKGELIATLVRSNQTVGRAVWSVVNAETQLIGLIQAGAGGALEVVGRTGAVLLIVESNPVIGLGQAGWRRLTRGSSKARGRLRVGMGPGRGWRSMMKTWMWTSACSRGC